MKKEWECWTLSTEDIDEVGNSMGLHKFSEEQYEKVARRFRKWMESSSENWWDILKEAIDVVLQEEQAESARLDYEVRK